MILNHYFHGNVCHFNKCFNLKNMCFVTLLPISFTLDKYITSIKNGLAANGSTGQIGDIWMVGLIGKKIDY